MVRPTQYEVHLGKGWCTSEDSLVKVVNQNDANGYYATLGLSPGATTEEIKDAYRKLVRKLHTDNGGDEDLFRFLLDVVSVLLDPKKKAVYDSVGPGHLYLGPMEREELARNGLFTEDEEDPDPLEDSILPQHWACLTTAGHSPGLDTDAWTDFCRQVSRAAGYRGRVRAGVVEGGRDWPCDPTLPWGILTVNEHTFVIFRKGVEPNRLHALCAMLTLQKQNTRARAQDEKRATWPLVPEV